MPVRAFGKTHFGPLGGSIGPHSTKERSRVVEAFVEEGKKAIRDDGVNVLIPGCMSMAFQGIAEDAQKELGVPVLNPAAVALKLAELYVSLGLSHNKRAYPYPPKGFASR